MAEEQVTRTVIEWLMGMGWSVLDYDFPGGGTGRKFHIAHCQGDKAKGIAIPDIVAEKNGVFAVFENKSRDTLSDYLKVSRMSAAQDFATQLRKAYPDRTFSRVLFCIAFSGAAKYTEQASASHVDVVVRVDQIPGAEAVCNILIGDLQ